MHLEATHEATASASPSLIRTDRDLFRRQLELEDLSVTMGVQRYEKDQPMPWRDSSGKRRDEADTLPGQEATRKALQPVLTALEALREKAFQSAKGRGRPTREVRLMQKLSAVDLGPIALISLRFALTCARKEAPLAASALGLASAIHDHYRFELFRKSEHFGLYRAALRQIEDVTDYRRRRDYLVKAMKKADVRGMDWTKDEEIQIGTMLMDVVRDATGLIDVYTRREGGKTKSYIRLTDAAAEWLDKAHKSCALLAPMLLPMVVPPVPWTNPLNGGYLCAGRLPRLTLVKTQRKQTIDELFSTDMPKVYNAINAVQATAWRINKGVLSVLNEAMERDIPVAGLPTGGPVQAPPRPADIPRDVPVKELPKEAQVRLNTWRSAAAAIHKENAVRAGDLIGVAQKRWVANTFAEYEAIWFPWTLDFRGRMYPAPLGINPQADDLGRALIEFAEGKPLGETGPFWLAVHAANEFEGGIEKAPLEERAKWTMDHTDLILDSALRPLDGEMFWTKAENPWRFLAVCFEWAGMVMSEDPSSYVSHMPVQMDGSCSGLQHYSAALLDEEGAIATNVLPSKDRQDIYGLVAGKTSAEIARMAEAGDELAKAWLDKVNRKIVKQPTMTYAYSATVAGMRGQIETAMHKQDGRYLGEAFTNYQGSHFIAPIVRACIEDTVKAAAQAMEFLRQCAAVIAEADMPVRWVSPIGLPVAQYCFVQKAKKVEANMAGQRIQVVYQVDTTKADPKGHAFGVAPNVVHSWDASHAMHTVLGCLEQGITSFSMIHDSFGTHACDMDVMNRVLREEFIAQYSCDQMAALRQQFAAALPEDKAALLPPAPARGKADLSRVRESDYFFA